MRIEIRTRDHTNIDMNVEAITIELEDIQFCHEFFRLVDKPKGTMKLFYHGKFADDVSKVFEYESGSGTLSKDAVLIPRKENGESK